MWKFKFFLSLKFFPREVFGKGVLDLGFISTNIVWNWQFLISLLENLVAEKSFYFQTVILCLYWIDVVKQSMLHQTTQFISKSTVKLLGKMHLLFAKAKLTHKWKSTKKMFKSMKFLAISQRVHNLYFTVKGRTINMKYHDLSSNFFSKTLSHIIWIECTYFLKVLCVPNDMSWAFFYFLVTAFSIKVVFWFRWRLLARPRTSHQR